MRRKRSRSLLKLNIYKGLQFGHSYPRGHTRNGTNSKLRYKKILRSFFLKNLVPYSYFVIDVIHRSYILQEVLERSEMVFFRKAWTPWY